MATRVVIKNIQAATKIAGGEAKSVEVRETGGGPPVEHQLAAGEEVEVSVGEDRKVSISELP